MLGTVGLTSCLATAEPLRTVEIADPHADPHAEPASEHADTLIVMLPGLGDEPEDYTEHGFIAQLQGSGIEADVVSVDAHLGYYTKRELLPRLRQDVFEPARARGYRSIWVVGISMGGLGALLSAREFSDQVAGVVVLSPYLGQRSVLRRIERAGGLRDWQPPAEPSSRYTVELWRWLEAYATDPGSRPPLYFAYGTEESARGFPLLAEVLPAERVLAIPGDHEWDTWSVAWAQLLRLPVFREPSATAL